MTDQPKIVVGLGELLWDLLPEGKQLGGAPANFSVMAARLGNRAVIASRLGEDPLGREAKKYLAALPADLELIQEDAKHPTGSVSVTLKEGQAEYVIHEPVAWDFLELTPPWKELAASADAVCFGSLAQREPVSRRTIHGFLAATRRDCVRVFDVNLRKPFYTRGVLEDSLSRATILKLNDAEMPEVLKLLRLEGGDGVTLDPAALRKGARALLGEFPIELVCITMGNKGSLLVTRESFDQHPGIPTPMADTIGAGDAFTAALTSYYLQGASLPVLNEAGNRWGSWIASQAGAMPALSEAKLTEIQRAISSV
ncbi:Fructokinase [Acidisarcina polymorpha]|uniref:Fructokinase n=1 Tax=Acidisarcina polymorpha TaxID=2211140 RepID=A0A2Z5FWX8_9BACT|nr:carbohydrate kinase [Acidisarcina polymorpha]AXC11007.1 Fructokinase [Acidisarcina polymorpha]